MLEIGILIFLALACGYWATLWIMGRRDDVLHGQFVEFEGDERVGACHGGHGTYTFSLSHATEARAGSERPWPVAATPAPDGEALGAAAGLDQAGIEDRGENLGRFTHKGTTSSPEEAIA